MKKVFALFSEGKLVRVYQDEAACRNVVEMVRGLLPGVEEKLSYEPVEFIGHNGDTKRQKRKYPDTFEVHWAGIPKEERRNKFAYFCEWEKQNA